MSPRRAEKKAKPSRLRTRLAFAFAIFALNIVIGLGLLELWFWESMHAGERAPLGSILLTAGILVIAVAALGGYLLAGPLARPMEMWAEAADRIGVGERDVTFPQAGGSHELARVSAALQSMFARLTEKEDRLEERIRERTAAFAEAADALAAERARLSESLGGSRTAFWELDAVDGRIRFCAEWAGMLGEAPGETASSLEEFLERLPDEERPAFSAKLAAALGGGGDGIEGDLRVRHADGTWLRVRLRGRVTARDAQGQALRLAGIGVDDGGRKAREERQRETGERLKALLGDVSSSVCQVDLTGRILFANKRYHEFYGLADGAAMGNRIREIAGDEGAMAFERCLPQLLAGHEVRYDREARVRGRRIHLDVHLIPQRDEHGVTESVYATITDGTERKAAERILERQQLTDATTGLPNRRCFVEHLESALARGVRDLARTAVLYVDLDNFKSTNERLGHDGGDALLRQVGARLVASVRGADTVARIEGDAFAILIDNCRSLDDAEVVARKLVEGLRAPFGSGAGEVSVSCSVGVALAPADGDEAAQLLRNAEKAMSRAKHAGKDRFATNA